MGDCPAQSPFFLRPAFHNITQHSPKYPLIFAVMRCTIIYRGATLPPKLLQCDGQRDYRQRYGALACDNQRKEHSGECRPAQPEAGGRALCDADLRRGGQSEGRHVLGRLNGGIREHVGLHIGLRRYYYAEGYFPADFAGTAESAVRDGAWGRDCAGGREFPRRKHGAARRSCGWHRRGGTAARDSAAVPAGSI